MRKLSRVLGFLALIIVVSGCSGPAPRTTEAKRVPEKKTAIPVEATLPTRGAISEYFDTTTRVEAERNVQVTAEGVGKCLRVGAEEGDRVNQGDLLAELDPAELNAQIASANSQLQKASSDYERSKQLFQEGLGPKVDYDNSRYAHEQQEANLKQLRVQLENMTVRAPLTGIITKKMVQEGQIVSSGSPIFEIVDPNSYLLTINAPEKDYLSRIKVGQKANVKLDSLEETLPAKVRKINPAVDEKTGTVKITLDFDKAAQGKLRDKAFARVNLVLTTHDNTLLLPKDVIMEENARKYVYVIEPSTTTDGGAEAPATPSTDSPKDSDETLVANRVEIKTGLSDSTSIEVLEGINENSLIVTVGQQTLKSGSEVKLTTTQDELLARAGLSAEEALEKAKDEHAKNVSEPSGQ